MTDSTEQTKDAALQARISALTAEDIVRFLAFDFGCEWRQIAARIADIPHSEWVALAMSDEVLP